MKARILPDPEAVSREAADVFAREAERALRAHAGSWWPSPADRRPGEPTSSWRIRPGGTGPNWARVHVFRDEPSDEPSPDDPLSNFRMARLALLDRRNGGLSGHGSRQRGGAPGARRGDSGGTSGVGRSSGPEGSSGAWQTGRALGSPLRTGERAGRGPAAKGGSAPPRSSRRTRGASPRPPGNRRCRFLRIPAGQIATMGDQPNGVLMFARSGLSIAGPTPLT